MKPNQHDIFHLKSKSTKRLTKELFIERAHQVHNGFYRYDDAVYTNNRTKVAIDCPLHGRFMQSPGNHILLGQGCPECGKAIYRTARLLPFSLFVERAIAKHGDYYDYSQADYKTTQIKIKIICPEHGEFWQTPDAHIAGRGCTPCGYLRNSQTFRAQKDDFIKKATKRHGANYDYSAVDYVRGSEKVAITCPEHGVFYQAPQDHLGGHGCPKCGIATVAISTPEQELADFVRQHVSCIQSDRTIIKPHEIDCVIESAKLGIEFCGIYYHSNKFKPDNYHLSKLERCQKAGYNLIQVFEDEWIKNPAIIKSIISNRLGLNQNKIYARNTELREIDNKDYLEFLNGNHIQGASWAEIRLGLYHQERLVMVTSFSRRRTGVTGRLPEGWYELVRMCPLINTTIVGGFSKCLKAFIKRYQPVGIKTFCDRRYFDGKGYEAVGFKLSHYSIPNYSYVKKQVRYSRYMFQKHKMKGKIKTYDPSLTERQIMENAGYARIYDCGTLVYVLKNPLV